jgi:hypothetical protein
MNSSQIQGGAEMKAMNARILISCLALAAMFIMAAPANAQGVAFQASSLPLQARGEGLTETIGAVVLQATGPGTVPAGSSITLVYSGSIANTAAFTAGGTAGLSCSINGVTTCAGFTTSATGSQLTVQITGTTVFKTGDYIEISQVRMNVNGLGSGTTTVTATLSGTSSAPTTNPITFTQSQVGVSSIVNPSIKASIATTAVPIQTCAVAAGTFSITVKENYPAAFTSLADENSFSPLGTISNGSWISVAVANVPTGFGVSWTSWTAAGTSPAVVLSPAGSSPAAGVAQISTGGTLTFTFLVTGDSTSLIDSGTLLFAIGYTNGKSTPALTGTVAPPLGTVVTATATVSLAPSSGTVSFATNNEGGGTIATLGDCVTNLLFPFSTNQVGFDTNIQISNTSADALAFPTKGSASPQAGTCTMTYYPTDLTTQTGTAAGTAGTPTQFTTPSIPAGGAYSFAQSTSTFKGQSGYMFAVCRFLDAHGFSFVVNGTPTTGTISQGLLALVIPNSSIAACPGAGAQCGRLANWFVGNSFFAGSYEALSH